MPKYGYTGEAPTFVIDASTGRWTFNYYTRYAHRKLIEDATNSYSYDSGSMTSSGDELRTWQSRVNNRLNVSYELSERSTIAVSEYIGNSNKDNRQSSLLDPEDDGGTETLLHGPESNFTQQTIAKYMLDLDDNGSLFEVTADYLHHISGNMRTWMRCAHRKAAQRNTPTCGESRRS